MRERAYWEVGATGPLESWRGSGPPEPEPLKLFRTTWLTRGWPYWWRRVYTSSVYGFVTLVIVLIEGGAVTALARALPQPVGAIVVGLPAVAATAWGIALWTQFALRGRRIDFSPFEEDPSGVGFAGFATIVTPAIVLVPFLFSLIEAPGEHRARLRYEEATRRWEKRQERLRAREQPDQ